MSPPDRGRQAAMICPRTTRTTRTGLVRSSLWNRRFPNLEPRKTRKEHGRRFDPAERWAISLCAKRALQLNAGVFDGPPSVLFPCFPWFKKAEPPSPRNLGSQRVRVVRGQSFFSASRERSAP